MSDTMQDIETKWIERISKELVGKTITSVEYLSPKEAEDNYWYKRPIAITFDDGTWIIPMSDDEGNDGGSLATSIEELQIIPVL
tara:strand:- start:86 stop:337 length:252 start_codon:yes stop_codon:yes gene_type:complete